MNYPTRSWNNLIHDYQFGVVHFRHVPGRDEQELFRLRRNDAVEQRCQEEQGEHMASNYEDMTFRVISL